MPKFLWFIEETKKYRLATKDETGIEYTITPEQRNETEKTEIVDGVHVSKLSITGQIYMPLEIRKHLDLKPGDKIGFILNENDSVEIRKAKLRLSFE